jgi:hypothetical protein
MLMKTPFRMFSLPPPEDRLPILIALISQGDSWHLALVNAPAIFNIGQPERQLDIL